MTEIPVIYSITKNQDASATVNINCQDDAWISSLPVVTMNGRTQRIVYVRSEKQDVKLACTKTPGATRHVIGERTHIQHALGVRLPTCKKQPAAIEWNEDERVGVLHLEHKHG